MPHLIVSGQRGRLQAMGTPKPGCNLPPCRLLQRIALGLHSMPQVDRRKQAAAERDAREAQEAAEQAEAERLAAETEAERAAAELRSALALKEAALPLEPGLTDVDSISVQVRMPDGSRLNRR